MNSAQSVEKEEKYCQESKSHEREDSRKMSNEHRGVCWLAWHIRRERLRRNNISWEESKERGIEVGVVLEGLGRG